MAVCHGEPSRVALTIIVPVGCAVWKFKVKYMVPPGDKYCVGPDEIKTNVAPAGPPDM